MVRKQDRQLETHIRSHNLHLACLNAGLRSPLRFKATNQKEPSELLWSHKDGRLSVYINPGGGFSIEDVPYNEVKGENLRTIPEVIQVLLQHQFLWDPNVEHDDPRNVNETLDEDGFPTI
jgi:hypothetical protein